MTRPLERILLSFTINLRRAAALAMVLALTVAVIPSAQAQNFQVLHNFSGGQDGANPQAGLSMDATGNLYGTTTSGGDRGECDFHGCGTVFRMQHKGSGWVFSPLYTFLGNAVNDGGPTESRVIFGPNGTLYGTTPTGGGASGNCGTDTCGTVFNLSPPPTACKSALCPWTKTFVYRFLGATDGEYPRGDLIFDQAGNIYGTTENGGTGCSSNGCGTVYELTPSGSGWTKSILYAFAGGQDGSQPFAGLTMDKAGNSLRYDVEGRLK